MILRVPSSISMLLLTVSLVLSQCETGEERAERHYQSGIELLEQGDPDRALVEFRNVFQLAPNHEGALETYARVQRERGKLRDSTRFYQKLVEQYPNNLAGRRSLGELSIASFNWEEAERHVRAAYQLDPDDTLIQAMNAALDYRAAILDKDDAKRAQAFETSKAILASNEDIKVSRRVVIDQLLADQKYSSALEELDRGLVEEPENLEYHELKLRALATLSDQPAVGEHLKVMVQQFPDNERIRAAMIAWFLQQRDLDGAEAFLRQLASGDDEVAEQSKVAIVQFLKETKGDEAARKELEALVESEEDSGFYKALIAVLDFETGNTEKALADLETVLESAEPSDKTNAIKVTLARLRLSTENNVGARALIEEVLAADPNQIDALKMRSRWLIEDDEAGEAIANLRTALDQAPRDTEVLTLMAEAHLRNGSRNLAGERLALAVEATNSAAPEALRYANFLMEDDQLAIAEGVLIDSLRRNNQNIQVLGTLGDIYLRQADWGRAQGVIDSLKSIEADQAQDTANSLQASLLLRQERSDESIAFLQQLIDQGDASTAAVAGIVRTHLSNGEVDEAKAYLDDALTKSPEEPILKFLRAGVHIVQGETEPAEKIYTALLEQSPQALNVINAKYALLMRTDRRDEAAEFLEQSIAATNGAPGLLWIKAGVLEQTGDIDGAIEIYEGLYEQNSSNLIVANNLASLITTHRTDEASLDRAFTIARRLRGAEQPAFQDTYGWIAYRRGDFAEAREHLEPAAEGLPNDPLVQYHLGMTYVALEESAKAREALERALELAGDSDLPQFQTARETLGTLPAE